MNNMGLSFLFFLSFGLLQVLGEEPSSALPVSFEVSTPFSVALDNLQTQINYTFKDVGFLRRAMTHASFSEENNKALSILGESVIETLVATRLLTNNVDISSKDLNLMIAKVSKVEGSCAADGNFLGLQKIVRVSRKTDAKTPAVVCGAFRAIFGAIAVDARSSDQAGRAYLAIHGNGLGEAVAM